MSSREKILAAVKKNQPRDPGAETPAVSQTVVADKKEKFKTVLTAIGGTVVEMNSTEKIAAYILNISTDAASIISTVPGLQLGNSISGADPHSLKNIDIAVLPGEFGVAENGAIWITDGAMGDRALPFICERLMLVIPENSLLGTMHDAYQRIGAAGYNFGTFIAGPSKTADIEQSLVLGAHGPKSLTVFLLGG